MLTPTDMAGITPAPIQEASSQNMFEFAAQQALNSQGTGPSEIGSKLMGTLDGFIDRNARFDMLSDASHPMNASEEIQQSDWDEITSLDSELDNEQQNSILDPPNFDHMVKTLGRVFDHAAETQLISSGATQVSSSVSSLLHGR